MKLFCFVRVLLCDLLSRVLWLFAVVFVTVTLTVLDEVILPCKDVVM